MQNAKKILVVDDEELVIKALTEKLSTQGFIVSVAKDGEEALLKVSQALPDLILLDIIMPKLDGISVLKRLKENDTTKNIPVIILTNLYEDKRVVEQLESGGTDYLVKVEHTLPDIINKVRSKLQKVKI